MSGKFPAAENKLKFMETSPQRRIHKEGIVGVMSMMSMFLTLLFTCLAFLVLSELGLSMNVCPIIARASVPLLPRFAQI
jgi:hypothetical protein